jgi:hypothetical protein
VAQRREVIQCKIGGWYIPPLSAESIVESGNQQFVPRDDGVKFRAGGGDQL